MRPSRPAPRAADTTRRSRSWTTCSALSRTNADDRLALAARGGVEGGHGVFEGRDLADVRAQASVAHALNDLDQLGAVGLDHEVDGADAGGQRRHGRSGDGYQCSTGADETRGS